MEFYFTFFWGHVVSTGYLSFPWFVLLASRSRAIAIFGAICCGVAGTVALLFLGHSSALAAFSAAGIFFFARRFKILGAFLSQLLWALLWGAYGFYYYTVVFPPINPNPINDTQCGVVLIVFIIFEAYFLFCLLTFQICRVLHRKITSRKDKTSNLSRFTAEQEKP